MLSRLSTIFVVMGATWGVVLLSQAHGWHSYAFAGVAALFQAELARRIDVATRRPR